MLQGRMFMVTPETYDAVTINSGSQGENRIDLITARYTSNGATNTQSMEWNVIQGTPTSGSPSAPTGTEGNIDSGDTPVDMPMFQVLIEGITITSVTPVFTMAALPITSGGTGATNAEDALRALKGVSITQIWENASPTSSFAAQTISIDLDDYDFVFITSASSSGATKYSIYWGAVGGAILMNYVYYTSQLISQNRALTVNPDSIDVANCTSNAAINNSVLVPIEIYGAKIGG